MLEWNSLGMWDDVFVIFCGGLVVNGVLQQLDFCNNQISYKGVEELVFVLKGNIIFQQLDLCWNNVGFLGGWVFMNCFFSNRILWRLDLVGNNIFGDVFRVVE